jgi:hypothetical protein
LTTSVGALPLPPPPPTQISPTGGGISTTPAFTFNTVAGGTGYLLEVDDNVTGTKIQSVWYTPLQVDRSGTGIDSITLAVPLANRTRPDDGPA